MRLSWKSRTVLLLVGGGWFALATDNPLSSSAYRAVRTLRHGGMDDASRLLVFVGEKIDVKRIAHEPCGGCIHLDGRYRARYRIVQPVYGAHDGAEISFDAYDHYGEPAFADHRHVLLFVSRTWDGSYLHHKYQFYPVFKTLDGRWAGCGNPYDAGHAGPRPVLAQPLRFDSSAWLPAIPQNGEDIATRFPAPSFRVEGFKAHCLMGVPVEGLLQVAREGVLAARGMRNWK